MSCVLLIDDHPMVLQGCRRVLQDANVREVLEANSVVSGYRLYRRHRPDLAIVDLALHGSGLAGLALIQRIRLHDSRTPILVFSMHGDAVIVSRALEAGANGYLLKDTAPEDFMAAVQAVRRGKAYICHSLAVQVAMLGSRRRDSTLDAVTPRELQTLALIADGKSYGQIADELGVSYKTVANTCSQLKVKLGAHNLPELIRMSIEFLSTSPHALRTAPLQARVA